MTPTRFMYGPKRVREVAYRQDAARRSDGPSTEVIIEAIP